MCLLEICSGFWHFLHQPMQNGCYQTLCVNPVPPPPSRVSILPEAQSLISLPQASGLWARCTYLGCLSFSLSLSVSRYLPISVFISLPPSLSLSVELPSLPLSSSVSYTLSGSLIPTQITHKATESAVQFTVAVRLDSPHRSPPLLAASGVWFVFFICLFVKLTLCRTL